MLGTCGRARCPTATGQPKHIVVCYDHGLMPEPIMSIRLLGRGRYRIVPAVKVTGQVDTVCARVPFARPVATMYSLLVTSSDTLSRMHSRSILPLGSLEFTSNIRQLPSASSLLSARERESETLHPIDHGGLTAHPIKHPPNVLYADRKLHVPCRVSGGV